MSIEQLAMKFGGLQTRVPLAQQKLQIFRSRAAAQRSGDFVGDLSDPVYAVAAYFLASKEEGQSDADFKAKLLDEHNVDKQHFQEVCRSIDQGGGAEGSTLSSSHTQRRGQPAMQPQQQQQQQQPKKSQRARRVLPKPQQLRSNGSLGEELGDSSRSTLSATAPTKKRRLERAPRTLQLVQPDAKILGGNYAAWRESALAREGVTVRSTATYLTVATGKEEDANSSF